MKTVKEHSLLAALILFVFLLFCSNIRIIAVIILSALWYERTHNSSFLIITLLLIYFCIPFYRTDYPEISSGRVTEVHASYAVVRSGRTKVLIYTDTLPVLDSVISFEGEFRQITSDISFYGFRFDRYCSRRGIYWSVYADPLETRRSFSIRGMLQKRIMSFDPETSAVLGRILFNIRSDDIPLQGWFNDSGFSLSGVTAFCSLILKRFCYPDTRKKAVSMITLFLAVIFHFPTVLTVRIIFDFYCTGHSRNDQRTGTALLLIMIIKPYCVDSASFLFPVMFRLLSFLSENQKLNTVFYTSILQSLIYHRFNPAEILMFRFLRTLSGALWVTALLKAFIPLIPLNTLVYAVDSALSQLKVFDIYGSILGAGLPAFVMILFMIRKDRLYTLLRPVILYAFLLGGMFHPFSEVTFINVGQGDSILIRMPFNAYNIMVDTGKPEYSEELDTILQAKSVRRIHTLMITHSDSDHCGNQEYIAEHYHSVNVITEHFDTMKCGRVMMADLNEIDNEDENQSSLVLYFELNGLSYLLTGDADETAEQAIVDQYGNLHADILKVSHHGSSTGSSEDFLDLTRPDLAVISCGSYNLYHHPSEQTIQRLLARHIPYLVTRQDGDITVLCLPFCNLVVTASGKISLLSS